MSIYLKDRILALADGTRTSSEIAEILGCKGSDVLRLVTVKSGRLKPSPKSPESKAKAKGSVFRRPSYSTPWDNHRTEELKRMWMDGMSASQIADRLGGGISRNSVIGKLHRLGLQKPNNSKPIYRKKPSKQKRVPHGIKFGVPRSPLSLPVEPVKMGPEPVVPEEQRRGVADLHEDQCRWPIGEPGKAGFHFCNGEKISGQSYCLHHLMRSYHERERPALMRKYAPSVGADEAVAVDENA